MPNLLTTRPHRTSHSRIVLYHQFYFYLFGQMKQLFSRIFKAVGTRNLIVLILVSLGLKRISQRVTSVEFSLSNNHRVFCVIWPFISIQNILSLTYTLCLTIFIWGEMGFWNGKPSYKIKTSLNTSFKTAFLTAFKILKWRKVYDSYM